MPSDRDTLIDFGFDPQRVDWALRATRGKGLQPAMDFIIENQDNPIPQEGDTASGGSAAVGGTRNSEVDDDEDLQAAIKLSQGIDADVGAEAKSIKCSECGKIFKNTALANFHAEKSGHDQFEESTEEIKPLTEEEKQAKLAELRTKMAEKRALKLKADAEENKANEALRRKAGKDAAQIREDIKAKELIKEAEAKRREKLEDQKARAAVKAQIEADKKARAEKAAMEKALRGGAALPQPIASTSTTQAPTQPAGTTKKVYTETRLQIRLTIGTTYTTTLPVTNTLQDVAEFLASQTTDVDVNQVTFSTTFPRKQFGQADRSKSLEALGLTPSAVLVASP